METKTKRLKSIAMMLFKGIGEDRILIFSGYVAFTTILAMFPFIIFMVSLASFLGGAELAQNIIQRGFTLLPHEVMDTLAPVVKETMGLRQGKLLTFGIIGTIWAASSGVESLRDGLNIAHRLKETRPAWWLRIQGLLFVIVASLVALLLAALVIGAPIALHWLVQHTAFDPSALLPINIIRYVVSFAILSAALLSMFRLLPNTSYRLKKLLPGAMFGAFLWMVLASLYSFYLAHFGSYNVTYGSLGGIIATMAFFQLSVTVILIGAELNATLHALEGEEHALTHDAKKNPPAKLNRQRISTSNAS